MKKKIRVVFIPTFMYLSSPIFENILDTDKKNNSEIESYYLDIESQICDDQSSESFKKKFDKIIKLDFPPVNNSFFKIGNFIRFVRFQNKVKRVIEKVNPDMIISASDQNLTTRIIKNLFPSIPMVIMQVALFLNKNCEHNFINKLKYLIFNKLFNVYCFSKQKCLMGEFPDNYYFLWGDRHKSFVSSKADLNRIKIVGNINFDKLFFLKKKSDENNSTEKRKTVVICTNPFKGIVEKEIIDELYIMYMNVIKDNKNFDFIIKPHPRENLEEIKEFFKIDGLVNYTISEKNIYELFIESDIYISSFSASALEAVACDIPILLFNPEQKIKLKNFVENVDLWAFNRDEANRYLKLITSKNYAKKTKEKRYSFISENFYKLDGNSSERVITELKKIINKDSFE